MLCALGALVGFPQVWGFAGPVDRTDGEVAVSVGLIRAGWVEDLLDAIRDLLEGPSEEEGETPEDGGGW
jgi:hypothetical protein